MATTTTNLGLTKPATSDKVDITKINSNMDKIDEQIGKTDGAIAIYAKGNTAPKAITEGQYVVWKGDLYQASKAISSGATLSTSNLMAVPDGGMNAMDVKVEDVKNNAITYFGYFTGGEASQVVTYELPKVSACYCVFVRKVNPTSTVTQGFYFIVTHTSGRIVINPILALGGGMSFTGEYTDDKFILTFNPNGYTYVTGLIFKIR